MDLKKLQTSGIINKTIKYPHVKIKFYSEIFQDKK